MKRPSTKNQRVILPQPPPPTPREPSSAEAEELLADLEPETYAEIEKGRRA